MRYNIIFAVTATAAAVAPALAIPIDVYVSLYLIPLDKTNDWLLSASADPSTKTVLSRGTTKAISLFVARATSPARGLTPLRLLPHPARRAMATTDVVSSRTTT